MKSHRPINNLYIWSNSTVHAFPEKHPCGGALLSIIRIPRELTLSLFPPHTLPLTHTHTRARARDRRGNQTTSAGWLVSQGGSPRKAQFECSAKSVKSTQRQLYVCACHRFSIFPGPGRSAGKCRRRIALRRMHTKWRARCRNMAWRLAVGRREERREKAVPRRGREFPELLKSSGSSPQTESNNTPEF